MRHRHISVLYVIAWQEPIIKSLDAYICACGEAGELIL